MIAISSTSEKKSSVKMNEDLAQWLNETPEKISGEFDTNQVANKPKGKCKICGTHIATAVCVKCGKPVCNDHYYHIIGVCENCLSKETVEKWKKHNPNWKKLLGVDWLD
jgi:hypothetical protein